MPPSHTTKAQKKGRVKTVNQVKFSVSSATRTYMILVDWPVNDEILGHLTRMALLELGLILPK